MSYELRIGEGGAAGWVLGLRWIPAAPEADKPRQRRTSLRRNDGGWGGCCVWGVHAAS
jgi:hypothetical protein